VFYGEFDCHGASRLAGVDLRGRSLGAHRIAFDGEAGFGYEADICGEGEGEREEGEGKRQE
jgi:hypothetical protein